MSWDVYLHGEWIDTIWFDAGCPAWYVQKTLVMHDGMNPNITVQKR